jgi:hypothetical protein
MDPVTISGLLSLGGSLVDRLFPDQNARAEQMIKLEKLAQDGNLAELQAEVTKMTKQMEINMKEAEHKSIFVAGWRPFVGWVCGIGLGYASIIDPLMRFTAKMAGYEGEFPVIDTTITMQVLFGMLGLGVMRSRDKEKGVASNAIRGKLTK